MFERAIILLSGTIIFIRIENCHPKGFVAFPPYPIQWSKKILNDTERYFIVVVVFFEWNKNLTVKLRQKRV